jgi:glycosyl-4,4'-diaponeurosporenoate acyltransferase
VRPLTLVAINTLGWAGLQLFIAAVAVRIGARHFARDSRLYRIHVSEIAFYRNWLRIRRWKRLLPDGAPWVGGSFRKKRLQGHDLAYLQRFVIETRRGEATHWIALACFPLFFPFDPGWARLVVTLYAIAANLPCIIVQRYNREAVQRLIGPPLTRADKPSPSGIHRLLL